MVGALKCKCKKGHHVPTPMPRESVLLSAKRSRPCPQKIRYLVWEFEVSFGIGLGCWVWELGVGVGFRYCLWILVVDVGIVVAIWCVIVGCGSWVCFLALGLGVGVGCGCWMWVLM